MTVLLCEKGRRAAKLYRDADRAPDAYDAGWLFQADLRGVSCLEDVFAVVDKVRAYPCEMLIRGNPAKWVRLEDEWVYRRSVPRPNEPASFESADRHWTMFDADKTGIRFDKRDLKGSVERWRESLPEDLREAEMFVQFSASQHRSDTVRVHSYIWTKQKLNDVRLRMWARHNGFDGSLYDAVHPHFTADPIFEGCRDPLDRKLIWLDGDSPRLRLPERAETEIAFAR
ncbi:MAG: hypothetical protein QM756_24035 [Polyangiaceae bacterium]